MNKVIWLNCVAVWLGLSTLMLVKYEDSKWTFAVIYMFFLSCSLLAYYNGKKDGRGRPGTLSSLRPGTTVTIRSLRQYRSDGEIILTIETWPQATLLVAVQQDKDADGNPFRMNYHYLYDGMRLSPLKFDKNS